MNLLHTVEYYYPSRGGAQEVVRQVSERLAQRGHTVTVATSAHPDRRAEVINGVRVVGFNISGNAIRGFEGETQRYQDFLRQGQFDLMMNYAAQEWTADLAFPILDELPYARVLVPCGFSGLPWPIYRDYYAIMPLVLDKYDALVFHATDFRDIQFARQHGLDRLHIIANGAAADEFDTPRASFREAYGISPDQPLLLTVGSHTGAKGHAETLAAFRRAQIGPSVLALIGNVSPGTSCRGRCARQAWGVRIGSLGRKRVLLLDLPRSQVTAAYQAADLLVFASNIEYSPLVLYEAAAAGLPFVASPAGNAEEIAWWTGGGVVLPAAQRTDGWVQVSKAELTQAIETLVGDPARRRALGAAGQTAWRERFTWEHLVGEYEALYRQAIARRGVA